MSTPTNDQRLATDPTEAEIRRRCEEIRATWPDWLEAKRRVAQADAIVYWPQGNGWLPVPELDTRLA